MRNAVYMLYTAVVILATSSYAADVYQHSSSKISLCLANLQGLRDAIRPLSNPPSADAPNSRSPLQPVAQNKEELLDYLARDGRYLPSLRDYIKELDEVELLGNGGMGMVYRVKKRATNEDFVIKLPLGTYGDRSFDENKTFLAEEAGLNEKAHALSPKFVNRAKYLPELGVMKMDLIKGKNLHRFIDDPDYLNLSMENKLKVQEVLLRQLTLGLSQMHSKGILHRDIKPENLMITGDINDPDSIAIKFIDFGLAADQKNQPNVRLPLIVGTPQFMAPSMLGGDSNRAADYYSLYTTIHNILSPRTSSHNSYHSGFGGARKVVRPWGTWMEGLVPQIAKYNPELRALMLLFKYPPQATNDYTALPDYHEMMDQALSKDPKQVKNFWVAFGKHVDARDPMEKGQILLGDDFLVSQGKKLYPNFDKAIDEGKKHLLDCYAVQQNYPPDYVYHPLEPVLLDLTVSQRRALTPEILSKLAEIRESARNVSLGLESSPSNSPMDSPIPLVVAPQPVTEKRVEQNGTKFPYNIAAGFLLGLGGGYGAYYLSQPATLNNSGNSTPNGDDLKRITDEITDPNSRITIIPAIDKTKKGDVITEKELQKRKKTSSDLLKK